MKDKGLSLISHDIRSALNDVAGGLRLVDPAALDSDSGMQLERARASVSMLARLLDEAFDSQGAGPPAWSHPQTQSSAPARDTTVLQDLLAGLSRRWLGHAAALGVTFRINAKPDPKLCLAAPPLVVERILSNLIENSILHAAFGRIVLTAQPRGDGCIRFTVTDEGPGFSAAALRHLFSRGGRPGAVSNVGLGLHIAKTLAMAAGGDVKVRNRYDANGKVSGACVSLVLPIAEADHPQMEPKTGNLADLNVLVADDSEPSCLVLGRMFEDLGAQCMTVLDGEAAFAALSEGGFDLLVIDAEMPGLSGLETIRKTRQLAGDKGRVPILVVSGTVLDEEHLRLFNAGANTILTKPVLCEEALYDAVATVLSSDRTEAQCAMPDLSLLEDGVSGSFCEPPKVAALRSSIREGGSFDVPEQLAHRLRYLMDIAGPSSCDEFIERLEADLARCREDLATAFYERNLRVIRAQTHVLISLTGAVGATALNEAVRTMNSASHDADWTTLHQTMARVWPDLQTVCNEVNATRAGIHTSNGIEVRPA